MPKKTRSRLPASNRLKDPNYYPIDLRIPLLLLYPPPLKKICFTKQNIPKGKEYKFF